MDMVFSAVADVLQLIVQPCYALTGNWWVSIFLFTLISKVILLPMSLWVQKNSLVMVNLMPALNRIKVAHYGDREAIGEKQSAMYKERGYHPLLSMVPLLVQVIILFGLVDVIHSITDGGAPGTEFLGMIPVEDGGASWIMPLLAGLSAVVMGCAQNVINPLQREQSRAEKNTTNGLSIGLSLVLGVFVSAGMCFYWICSNLLSIAVQALMNVMMPPAKHIDYDDLAESRADLAALEALDAGRKGPWWRRDPLAKRERADYKRFFKTAGKHIVFYSEGSGFYKYFKGAIEYLLENSDGVINYVTNDPDDQIFKIAEANPRIRPYYIGQKRAITLMMKMDADVVVTTLEDLENYYIKRSYVRKDIEYVFMVHHMTSMHLTPSKQAYDHYDTVLCAGPHQVAELRREEELYNLPAKNLVECGYALLDEDIAAADARKAAAASAGAVLANGASDAAARPTVLLAPSWQEANILDSCVDDLLAQLIGRGWRVVVRPHPEYVKRYRPRWDALVERWSGDRGSDLVFESDFSSNESVFSSDVLITDWSSIFCEFSFSTLRPSVFIDTPMKVGNPDWAELGIEPTDISLRNRVGRSFDPAALSGLGDAVAEMIAHPDAWAGRIAGVRGETISNIGHAKEAAGKYLLDSVMSAQERHDAQAANGEDA